jgi:hypothetical protein
VGCPAAEKPEEELRSAGVTWFEGDFESGGLAGWGGALPGPKAAQIVTEPVRRGRYAVRFTLAPGDRVGGKERVELRVADRDVERLHGGDGRTLWYAMSMLLPTDHVDPPGGQYPIVAQWHHRPVQAVAPGKRAQVTGPPPLALYLVSQGSRQTLLLVHHASPSSPARRLGERPIGRGRWLDLVFEVKESTGPDGYVRAWLDGESLIDSDVRGPTVYNPLGNYLRFGYYRAKGGTTTNHLYFDEVRIGDSRAAVTGSP